MKKPPPDNGDDLFDWAQRQPPPIRSYLIRTDIKRRRCWVFVRNPNWNGVLKVKAGVRPDDPETSHDAAESIPKGDIYEAKIYVDEILALGQGIISNELCEYVLEGIAAGRIDSKGVAPNVRARSIRRRFSDFCP